MPAGDFLARRSSGILLHPTSLPGACGIGDFGREARRFVDFLAGAGQSLWQVLPLGPTGYGDSPYQCFSAFAGDPLFLSLDTLVEQGLLPAADLKAVPPFPAAQVDYGWVKQFKLPLLRKAWRNFRSAASPEQREQFETLTGAHAAWLDDYALFWRLRTRTEVKPSGPGGKRASLRATRPLSPPGAPGSGMRLTFINTASSNSSGSGRT